MGAVIDRTKPNEEVTAMLDLLHSKMRVMLGVKSIAYSNEKPSVMMTVGSNPGKFNKVKLAFDRGTDTYKLEFYRIRKGEVTHSEKYEGIYNDSVERTIGSTLQMDTTL